LSVLGGESSYSRAQVRQDFKRANIKTLIIEHAKDYIFHDVDAELVQRLFDEVELD